MADKADYIVYHPQEFDVFTVVAALSQKLPMWSGTFFKIFRDAVSQPDKYPKEIQCLTTWKLTYELIMSWSTPENAANLLLLESLLKESIQKALNKVGGESIVNEYKQQRQASLLHAYSDLMNRFTTLNKDSLEFAISGLEIMKDGATECEKTIWDMVIHNAKDLLVEKNK